MNGYQLTRRWFDFAFDHKEVKPQHTALYCWCVELNNRLGWKDEFGLPTLATMEGLSIGNKNTFLDTLKDLVEWEFIEVIQESKNQNISRIIRLRHSENATALYTALDTAILQQCNSTDTSTAPIVKQLNQETIKPINIKKERNKFIAPSVDEIRDYFHEKGFPIEMVQQVYSYYADSDWTKSNGVKVIDWKRTIRNNWKKSFDAYNAKQEQHQKANQTYYPPKPEEDPILLRQEVHSNYGDYVRHCLKVNHKPEKPKYPELFPADFDYVAFINQIKAEL